MVVLGLVGLSRVQNADVTVSVMADRRRQDDVALRTNRDVGVFAADEERTVGFSAHRSGVPQRDIMQARMVLHSVLDNVEKHGG